eukprot:6172411-Pleurochrysis_carterae.AAC.1
MKRQPALPVSPKWSLGTTKRTDQECHLLHLQHARQFALKKRSGGTLSYHVLVCTHTLCLFFHWSSPNVFRSLLTHDDARYNSLILGQVGRAAGAPLPAR